MDYNSFLGSMSIDINVMVTVNADRLFLAAACPAMCHQHHYSFIKAISIHHRSLRPAHIPYESSVKTLYYGGAIPAVSSTTHKSGFDVVLCTVTLKSLTLSRCVVADCFRCELARVDRTRPVSRCCQYCS